MSITISIILTLLIVTFGKDFYRRENPVVIRETEILEDYELNNLYNSNFSIAIRLEDENGSKLSEKYNELLVLRGFYKYYERVNGEWTYLDSYLELVNCTEKMFYSESIFNKYGLDQYFCPVFNNTKFEGSWSSDKLAYFYFEVNLCAEGKYLYDLKDSKISCKSNTNFRSISNDLSDTIYLSVFYQEALFTPSNYTNGINYAFKNDYFLLNKALNRNDYYYFKTTKLITDYGWLIEDKHNESILGISSKTSSITINDYSDEFQSLGTMIFYMDKDNDLYRREYIKLQVLAANVGGIIKLLYVLAQLLCNSYAYYDFIFDLSKKLNIHSNLGGLSDDNVKSTESKLTTSNSSIIRPQKINLLMYNNNINNNINNNNPNSVKNKLKQAEGQENKLKEQVEFNSIETKGQNINKLENLNTNNINKSPKNEDKAITQKIVSLIYEEREDSNLSINEYSTLKFFAFKVLCCLRFKKLSKFYNEVISKTISLLEIKNILLDDCC